MATTDPGTGNTPSRRTFLKQAGGAVAVGLAAGAYAAPDETVRLALIGCGGRGTGAVVDAFAYTSGPVKLHAMADLFDAKVQAKRTHLMKIAKDKMDVPPERCFVGFDAYRKAIDTLRPGDVAILTTHAAFRPMMFEYAVSKGVNVFMEKSFAVDAPNARRLLAAAEASEKKNLKVGVGFMWRHSKARQEVIQRIHDGAIGDVQTLRIYRVHGPVHCPPLPKGANEIEFQLRHATNFIWASSGFFIDWHCHNVDVACWAKGAWPVAAQGMGGRCYREAGNNFDHYTIEFTFADGAKLLSFSRHMRNCWGTYADYAHGTNGSAVIMTNLRQPSPKIYKNQQMTKENVTWKFEGADPSPYRAEWRALLDAVRNDTPHNEARRAGMASIAALMGRAATHTGQVVTWDQMMASKFQFVKNIDGLAFDSPAPIKPEPDGIYPCPVPGTTVEV
ncbi:Gfo/Idh/MocA family oxidoreductase [bacterium]|nr:Gfo/Idh/MocA family oxidoreductase [bacterium]